MISGTDRRGRAPAGGRGHAARRGYAGGGGWRAGAAAPLLLIAFGVLAAPGRTTPADLRSILEKTDKTLSQAERAVGGKDPGRVSLILARVDELLVSFQQDSGLESLVKAFDDARAAARAPDMDGATSAVARASALMSPVTDFVVLREAAETSRAALRAADEKDPAAFLEALERFDASILAPVLLARVREARAAIARARQAMVRNNMPDGRARLAEARRALNGLVYAGALSRSAYAIAMGSELLGAGSTIAARDQLQRGLRDLRLASETGPEDARPAVLAVREETLGIWKRSGRPAPEDAGRLMELVREIDAFRVSQPR